MTTRNDTGLSCMVRNGEWPRPVGWARPEHLALGVETLPGVGATLARKLHGLGLGAIDDLLFRKPRAYQREADVVPITSLADREEVVIEGTVENVNVRKLRGRRTLVVARVRDDSGAIKANFFNQPWLADKLKLGTPVRLRGRLSSYGFEVKSH